jgi:hypothetical protein
MPYMSVKCPQYLKKLKHPEDNKIVAEQEFADC